MKKDRNIISQTTDLQDILSEGIAYYDGNIMMIDRLQDIKAGHTIMKVDAYILILCLKGKGSFYMNDVPRTINENDLFICHPNVILEHTMVSVDFECCGFVFSSQYVQQLNIVLSENWNLKILLEKEPVLPLTQRETIAFIQYYNLLRSKFIDPPHKHRKELICSILQAFSYDFYRVQERFVQQVPQNALSSAENLFKKFVSMLSSFAPGERKVAFYAEKLFVTPKYLSSICKAQSGYTASELINRAVIKEIEFMLKQSDKSVKEIANEINFPNLSFFGKYVRANLGMSPKQYRKKLLERKLPDTPLSPKDEETE